MRVRVFTVMVALGIAMSGCGGDSTSDTPATSSTLESTTTSIGSTTTSVQSTTTTLPSSTTSTVPASTTTTLPPAPPAAGYVVVAASILPAEPLPNSGGAGGSGCAPGPGALPDGIWYGTVLSADQDSVDLDLACFYFGPIAWEVAAEVGEEAYNDYWITNENPTLRTVPVSAGAVVWSIPGDLGDLVPLSFSSDWPPNWTRAYAECPGESCGVWLYINQGLATELVEQYVP